MPCYVKKTNGPTRAEFEQWQKLGYIGTWEQYSASKRANAGGTMFICGDLGDHCRDCSGFGDFLCDYPVGDGKTCDAPLCDDHATEVAPEVHYCAGHFAEWEKFRESGGVAKELENIVAFPKPR